MGAAAANKEIQVGSREVPNGTEPPKRSARHSCASPDGDSTPRTCLAYCSPRNHHWAHWWDPCIKKRLGALVVHRFSLRALAHHRFHIALSPLTSLRRHPATRWRFVISQ